MRLTVVIPTRDRPALISDCLETLRIQPPPPDGWEVIVVDDGSAQPLGPLVRSVLGDVVPTICVRLEGDGLNAARNSGVEHARGELVAFLDDDTLVANEWAKAIDKAFATTSCDAVGGRVTLGLEGATEYPRWLTERRRSYLSQYDLGDVPVEVVDTSLPVGANFAVRADALAGMGGFRVDLDRSGTELISNGEQELLRRLRDRGGKIVYWPDAAVKHRVPSERLNKDWFRRRARAQGISDVRMRAHDRHPYPIRRLREAARVWRALPILMRRLTEGRGSFDAELWLIDCRARLEELRRERDLDRP
jgi:glycosyltransferase involved in cell wall biosynthesis